MRGWLGLVPGSVYQGMPEQRRITLVVHNIDASGSVVIDGAPVQGEYDAAKKQLTVAFDWDHGRKILLVK